MIRGLFLFSIFLNVVFYGAKGRAAGESSARARQKPAVICVELGGSLVPAAGSSPGSGKWKIPCCEGLTSVTEPGDAVNGAAPGRVICAACGDRKCEAKFENKLNCPKDCVD